MDEFFGKFSAIVVGLIIICAALKGASCSTNCNWMSAPEELAIPIRNDSPDAVTVVTNDGRTWSVSANSHVHIPVRPGATADGRRFVTITLGDNPTVTLWWNGKSFTQ